MPAVGAATGRRAALLHVLHPHHLRADLRVHQVTVRHRAARRTDRVLRGRLTSRLRVLTAAVRLRRTAPLRTAICP